MGKKSFHRSRSNSQVSADRSGESRKRRYSSSSSSTDSHSQSLVSSKKRPKRAEEKKHRKKRSSSASSDSSSSSSSSKKKKRKHKRLDKHKLKEKKRKLKKKLKKEKKRLKKEAAATIAAGETTNKTVKANEVPKTDEPDEEMLARAKAMAPMTKEEWEKRQSVIKRVYDEETGRYRLIKGDGEVLEEIVSRDRHREINKQATRGDGAFFQAKLATTLHQ